MFHLKLLKFHFSTKLISKPAFNSSKPLNLFKNSANSSDTINPADILKIDQIKSIYQKQSKSNITPYENFEEIRDICPDLLTKLNQNGIFKPTEIQKNMLGHYFGSKSSDLLIKSLPGSGKSLGYIITLLSDYYSKSRSQIQLSKSNQGSISCKYLIIVPTELLAKQLFRWIKILGDNNVSSSPIVSIMCETFSNLESEKASDFLISTPEAFRTKMAQGLIDFRGLESVVLDEADALIKPLKRFASSKQKEMRAKHPVTSLVLLSEMMKSFQVNKLFKRPRMIVSSATLNKLTRDELISKQIVKDPVFIEDKQKILTDILPLESNVQHYHSLLKDPQNPDELVELLSKIIKQNAGKVGLLFLPSAQSKLGLCELLNTSSKAKFSEEFKEVSFGLLCQKQNNLQSTRTQVYIASDVDCRGIDIPELSFVIILDLPSSLDNFIHMTGRVGRVGQQNPGNVYTILGTMEDLNKFTTQIRQISLTTMPFIHLE